MKRISTTKPALTHITNSLLVLNWFKLPWFHCELTKPYKSASNWLVSLAHVNTLKGYQLPTKGISVFVVTMSRKFRDVVGAHCYSTLSLLGELIMSRYVAESINS